MLKFVLWLFFGICIAIISGFFPHVAVGITAICLVILFLVFKDNY